MIVLVNTSFSQIDSFSIKEVSFNSSLYDDFAPIIVDSSIIFCSNRPTRSLINYSTNGQHLFNIWKTSLKDSTLWNKVELYSEQLVSKTNNGPATFSDNGELVVFVRNRNTHLGLKNINKIGLFTAQIKEGKWTNIKPFPFNDTCSLKSPYLAHKGTRLFFSANFEGGYGGFDIYYSDLTDSTWSKPVNLGPAINTLENEDYPFVLNNILYFSSNGHQGFGEKDLFTSMGADTIWQMPTNLGNSINSSKDDYGLISNNGLNAGYFCSNRNGTDDIFEFQKISIHFPMCIKYKEEPYCYKFQDEHAGVTDTINTRYEWFINDELKVLDNGENYCFETPGNYQISLVIINNHSGDTINIPKQIPFKVEEYDQVYIYSADSARINEPILFNSEYNCKEEFIIHSTYWNFGNGYLKYHHPPEHTFKSGGIKEVQVGIVGFNKKSGAYEKICSSKKIIINP